MAQEAARLLVRFGRRYAAVVRLVTLLPICMIALFRSAPENLAPTVVVVAVAAVWICGYAWWLDKGKGNVPVVLDVLVLLGLSACVGWTSAVEDTNTGWLRLLVLFMCVTCQWHTPVLVGAAAALTAGGGLVVAVAEAGADASVIRGLLWAPVAAALSRVAWILLRRAAHQADLTAAEAARARGQSLLAAAARAEEREFANALHDTAATTLLMVGIGQVRSDAGWLAAQARRDLDRLGSGHSPALPHADVVGLLRADLDAVPLTVEFDAPKELRLPYDVARAIADAAGEALTNVRRHADTTRATIRLCGDSRALRLDIADQGRGFSPAEVPATRYGLRESVHGRMTRIGGTATITSASGKGALVRLEWRAGDG
ncbi:sensor histidine kinase [Nonomuraea sp. NPDC050022]|uniref:sensor histidine kinase n=1 Tax=unclassified Nonomuraea TaxID=2593643 RepID=UPI00340A7954